MVQVTNLIDAFPFHSRNKYNLEYFSLLPFLLFLFFLFKILHEINELKLKILHARFCFYLFCNNEYIICIVFISLNEKNKNKVSALNIYIKND